MGRQEAEVAEVLEFALDDLVAGHSLKRLVRRGMAFKTDVYEVGGHMVWGATARILGDLLTRLEPVHGGRFAAVSQRVAPTSSGICQVSRAARAIASPSGARPRRRRRARGVSTSFSQNIRSAALGRSRVRTGPSASTTIVTPCSASISVAIRSGSPT